MVAAFVAGIDCALGFELGEEAEEMFAVDSEAEGRGFVVGQIAVGSEVEGKVFAVE